MWLPTGFLTHYHCLDEDFDAPDIAADHDLCCAIAAGKSGLHPDVWSTAYEPLAVVGRYEPAAPEEAKHRRRPVEHQPPSRPVRRQPWRPPPWRQPQFAQYEDVIEGFGWLKLTCDECDVQAPGVVRYPTRQRAAYVAKIRAAGRELGWTTIVGRDRCPACSRLEAPAPEPVDHGAGGDESDEQHA